MEWLTEVFDPSTKEVTHDTTYRLLVLDGHDSHVTGQFVMACLGPLQKAYGDLVNRKSENGVDSINKGLFIDLYTEAREQTFRPKVIQAGFKATDLVPFNPQEVYKRLSQRQKDHSGTIPEPELPGERLSPKTPKTSQQLRDQIQLRKIIHQSPTTELRLRKPEKGFAQLQADNILLNQQNRLLFSENRVRKIKSSSRRLISNDGRLMTKEAALIQQKTASNKEREQIQKTRFRMAKKEYQEYLRQKNSHRKTLPKHKFIIVNYKSMQSEIHHDSSDETTDSEEDLVEQDTPDVYQGSSDIELEASEASDEEMDEAG